MLAIVKSATEELRETLGMDNEDAANAEDIITRAMRQTMKTTGKKFCCAVCQRDPLRHGVALERVSVTGKDAPAIWLCHQHLKRDIGFQLDQYWRKR